MQYFFCVCVCTYVQTYAYVYRDTHRYAHTQEHYHVSMVSRALFEYQTTETNCYYVMDSKQHN